MKRIIYLFLFLAIGGTATAQTISVPDVEVLQGETASYSLNINVDREYDSFQCDVQFPATGFSIPAKPNTTVNPLWVGGIFGQSTAMDNGAYRLGGMGTTLIPSGDIEIGTVAFTVGADTPVGEYDVTITNFEFIRNGVGYPANDVTFKVKVVSVVTLDENSTEAPAAANGVNVLVKRTIAANEWGTICLPFAMSAEQVTAAFGDDMKLCDFTGYTTSEDASGDIVGITVSFSPVSVIEANHPYIIKVSSPVVQFEVNGVDIAPVDEPLVATVPRTRKQWSELIGTYVADTTVPDQCLFLSGGKFYYSKNRTKMKGYRAYFDFYDVLTEVENAAGAKIGFNIDGETTGIDNSQQSIVNSNDGWYTLDGIKLNGEPKRKGIYIHNGKKVKK